MSDAHVTVCGEVEYDGPNGYVHSDICIVHDGPYSPTAEQHAFLHACLDEWLTKSNGSGRFWIGSVNEPLAGNEL